MRFQVVPAAYVLLVRGAGNATEVLLQLRQNTGYADGRWAAGAAGHVEAGESVLACAVRETREELGVEAWDLQPMTTLHRTDGTHAPIEQRVDFFFACRAWDGEPTALEPHKVADLRWFPLADLPENLSATERLVLEGWRAGTLPAITALGFDA